MLPWVPRFVISFFRNQPFFSLRCHREISYGFIQVFCFHLVFFLYSIFFYFSNSYLVLHSILFFDFHFVLHLFLTLLVLQSILFFHFSFILFLYSQQFNMSRNTLFNAFLFVMLVIYLHLVLSLYLLS
jgi:hypothetical protein